MVYLSGAGDEVAFCDGLSTLPTAPLDNLSKNSPDGGLGRE